MDTGTDCDAWSITMKPEELTDQAIDFMFEQGFTKLTEWETNFVESVEDQWHHRRRLSEKQKEILGRIWDAQP